MGSQEFGEAIQGGIYVGLCVGAVVSAGVVLILRTLPVLFPLC